MVEPCNAIELMLRSGRMGPLVEPARPRSSEIVDLALDDLGQRLGVALIHLSDHRSSADEGLRHSYRAIHGAMSDLAAILIRLSVPRWRAGRARPARRRRPWGARS